MENSVPTGIVYHYEESACLATSTSSEGKEERAILVRAQSGTGKWLGVCCTGCGEAWRTDSMTSPTALRRAGFAPLSREKVLGRVGPEALERAERLAKDPYSSGQS